MSTLSTNTCFLRHYYPTIEEIHLMLTVMKSEKKKEGKEKSAESEL